MRVLFALFLVACGAQPGLESPEIGSDSRGLDARSLRVVAANLTSGPSQSYDPGHGARILKALTPDIILIQELNYGSRSDEDTKRFVEQTFGAEFTFVRDGGRIPNGVISRFPILGWGTKRSPRVSDRDMVWAMIDIPGEQDLLAVSVHFYSKSSSVRAEEALVVASLVRDLMPAGGLVLVGGDFNAPSDSDPSFTSLQDVVDVAAPRPVDQAGLAGTNASRAKPYDQLLASPSMQVLSQPVRIGDLAFDNGLVVDTRVFQPLSLLPGVDVNDSGAHNMQHMAIVREFRLSAAPPPQTPPALVPLRIDEYLADEPGVDTALEYIELYNTNAVAVSLAGYTLSDSRLVRHVFAEDAQIAAGGRVVIYGSTASSGTLALTNGGDTISFADATGALIDSVSYTASVTGVSAARNAEGVFVPHDSLDGTPGSPLH